MFINVSFIAFVVMEVKIKLLTRSRKEDPNLLKKVLRHCLVHLHQESKNFQFDLCKNERNIYLKEKIIIYLIFDSDA